MKKCRLILLSLLWSVICIFHLNALTTVELVSELESSYASSFYPGVVRYADEIISSKKRNGDFYKAVLYKGESLYKMGRIKECLAFLQSVREHDNVDRYYSGVRNYWEGMCLFDLRRYDAAQNCFYASSKSLSKVNESKLIRPYYSYSVLMGARSFYELGQTENAIPLYEYVICNGAKYSQKEYEESVTLLLTSYNIAGYYVKAKELYEKVKNENFSDIARYSFMLCAGVTEEGLLSYKNAYDLYCKILLEGPSTIAASAMEKAYSVSSKHKNEVGSDPGSVFALSQDRLKDYPSLLSEFWTRLAIDCYNSEDYQKALNYFDEAKKTASAYLLQLACLYRAEVLIKTGKSEKTDVQHSLDLLNRCEDDTTLSEQDSLYYDYMLAKSRYSGILCQWDNCIAYAEKAFLSKSLYIQQESSYWKALALYNQNRYAEAEAVIRAESSEDNKDVLNLLAHVYAKLGRSHEADVIFYSLGLNNQLDNNGRLDYSRTLLNAGHLISASEQSVMATGGEALYLSGLSAFNRKNWDKARVYMDNAIKSDELDDLYYSYALFYSGYSNYRLSDYDRCCERLYKFLEADSSHPLYWHGLMALAKSLNQIGEYEKAVPFVIKAVKTAEGSELVHEAVNLCCGTYCNIKQYDEALSVLAPYVDGQSYFDIECRFKAAEIYGLKKNYTKADELWLSITFEKNALSLSEDAAYRRGELCYSTGNYKKAVTLFDEYCKKWYNGKYYYAAIYFAADALSKCNQKEKSLLYYSQIINTKEYSTYKYGSLKNAVSLYVELDEYKTAVTLCETMLKDFTSQAKNDGIDELLSRIKTLANSTNRKLAIKEYEFKKAGALTTVKGRVLGNDYAELLYRENGADEGTISFVRQLLSEQEKHIDDEYMYALKSSLLLCKMLREKSHNEECAQLYLKAAEYGRLTGDDESAAFALYGCIEAFDAAGKYGDSKASFNTLKELYPKSDFVKNASKIIN